MFSNLDNCARARGSVLKIALWWENLEQGGMETHVSALLDAWPSSDDSFVLFTNTGNIGLEKVVNQLDKKINLQVVMLPDSETLSLSFGLIGARFFLPLMRRLWRKQCVDVLKKHHAFDIFLVDNGGYPGSIRSLTALAAAKDLGIKKRILLIHHSSAKRRILRTRSERCLDQNIECTITDLISLSDATRCSLSIVREFNFEKYLSHVVHNGIDLVQNLVAEVSIRNQINLQPGELVVGMLGRVKPYKGHEDLLHGVSQLDLELKNRIVIVFVGPVTDFESLRLMRVAHDLQLENRVHILGYSNLSSFQIVRQFDLLVSATRDFEAFGLTIAEAMSQRTPVLVTRVGGVIELVDEGSGFIVSPKSPTEIANAVRRFIQEPEYVDIMIGLAFKRVQQFSASTMAKKVRRVMTSEGAL